MESVDTRTGREANDSQHVSLTQNLSLATVPNDPFPCAAGIAGHIAIISGDPTLRYFGVALCAVNCLTAIHWLRWPSLSAILDPAIAPVCWPFFPGCYQVRVVPPELITSSVFVFLLASLLNARLFVTPRRIAAAYWTLLGCSVLKYLLIFQDFRLTLNHHYMAGWIVVAYLFAKSKQKTIQLLIVSMYFWAGVLKLDPGAQWLTGAAFYGRRPLGMPEAWIPMACMYVIILEVLLVFGLLSKQKVWFWGTFGQVLLFHVSSFWVVGWFYPLLMFALLSIFPMARLIGRGPTTRRRDDSILVSTIILLAVFSLLQLARFTFPGRSAITGQGRMLALNMFDAPLECHGKLLRVEAGNRRSIVQLRPQFVNTRTMCDPLIYLELARGYCRAVRDNPSIDFDLSLETRTIGGTYWPVVSAVSICSTKPEYSLLYHNDWILVPR
jgi:uncharacterized membrane protein YhdT